MLSKKKDAAALIEQYQQLLAPYQEIPCSVSFGTHTFDILIKGLELGKTTGLMNAPNKRTTEDGKQKTPMVFKIITVQGDLYFVFDDTIVTPLFNGVRFQVGNDLNVDIRRK